MRFVSEKLHGFVPFDIGFLRRSSDSLHKFVSCIDGDDYGGWRAESAGAPRGKFRVDGVAISGSWVGGDQ
jgi:hypothetical protein